MAQAPKIEPTRPSNRIIKKLKEDLKKIKEKVEG